MNNLVHYKKLDIEYKVIHKFKLLLLLHKKVLS